MVLFPCHWAHHWINVCCSVAQLCLTLCHPMDSSTPGFPALHHLLDLAQTHVHWVGMPSNYLILCHPLLPTSIFPRIMVFSNESVLHIMWPKYWSFSFSINPSQHQALFQGVSSSHHVAKVLEFQFQYQSFQWNIVKAGKIKSISIGIYSDAMDSYYKPNVSQSLTLLKFSTPLIL